MHSDLREKVRSSPWAEPAFLFIALVLFAIQTVAMSFISPDGEWAWIRRPAFFVATPLLILVALHFRRFLGAWLIALGIAMNFVPMAAHGGNMPVAYEVVRDSGAFPYITEDHIGTQLGNSKDVVLWKEDIRFEFLSDNIVVHRPWGLGTNIYSPGDIVLATGVLVAAVEAVALMFGLTWRRLFDRLHSRRKAPAG